MLQERTILKVVSKVTSNQKKLLEECFFILVVVVVVIVVFSLHPKKCDDACVEWQSMFLLFFVFFLVSWKSSVAILNRHLFVSGSVNI